MTGKFISFRVPDDFPLESKDVKDLVMVMYPNGKIGDIMLEMLKGSTNKEDFNILKESFTILYNFFKKVIANPKEMDKELPNLDFEKIDKGVALIE